MPVGGRGTLRGHSILVVEDDYMIASDLARALEDLGASIIGPVGSVADAMSVLAGDTSLNAAVLDVNLAGDKVYPVATELRRRGIAFAFATGYDDWIIPESLADAPRFEKPVNVRVLAQALIAKRSC
jgi:CheY-like chemotaxis protein